MDEKYGAFGKKIRRNRHLYKYYLEHKNTMKVAEIAKVFHLSRQRAHQIIKGMEVLKNQYQ